MPELQREVSLHGRRPSWNLQVWSLQLQQDCFTVTVSRLTGDRSCSQDSCQHLVWSMQLQQGSFRATVSGLTGHLILQPRQLSASALPLHHITAKPMPAKNPVVTSAA